jgi:hypothetical protein
MTSKPSETYLIYNEHPTMWMMKEKCRCLDTSCLKNHMSKETKGLGAGNVEVGPMGRQTLKHAGV